LEVGKNLEQERLELFVRAIDLVDEQDRRFSLVVLDRLEQRTFDEKCRAEDLALDACAVVGFRSAFGEADVEYLLGIVPFVERMADIEALIALQSDEPTSESRREHLCHFGLADAGFAFEEQWSLQPQGQEDRRRETLVGEVVVRRQRPRRGPATCPADRRGRPGRRRVRSLPARDPLRLLRHRARDRHVYRKAPAHHRAHEQQDA